MAVSALLAVQQTDFQIVKQTLLSVYQISSKTRRKKVFEQTFNASKPDQWLRETEFSSVARLNGNTYQRNCADGVSYDETSELARESDRNLNCQSYEGLAKPLFAT